MRKADVAGDNARAWLVPKDRARVWAHEHPEKLDPLTVDTTACVWYVNGRGFHAFWEWWAVSAVSLADIEGLPPAHKHYPQAEWEMAIYSLNPEQPNPEVNGQGAFDPLMPPDMVVQFHGITRKQTEGVVRLVVEAICAGRTSPDADWRRQNKEVVVKLVNDYYIGLYGGPSRPRKLEVNQLTGSFTGELDPESWL